MRKFQILGEKNSGSLWGSDPNWPFGPKFYFLLIIEVRTLQGGEKNVS